MSEKSFVGTTCCIFCGETKEVILDRRMKDTLQQNMVVDDEPCDKCKEQFKLGLNFMEVIPADGSRPEHFEHEITDQEGIKRKLYLTGDMTAVKMESPFVKENFPTHKQGDFVMMDSQAYQHMFKNMPEEDEANATNDIQ